MVKSGCFCEPEQMMAETDSGRKAIIITDDRFLMKLLRYALSSSEIKAACFSNRMSQYLPPIGDFDTIIVDYDTAGLSSRESIQRLRALYPRAIIIVVSQWDVGIASLRAGANDFLRKPFVPYRLAMMINGGDILS